MVFPRRCSRRYWPVPSYSHFESAHLSGPSGSKAALHIATKKHRPLLLSWNHRNKGEQLATLVNRGPIAPRILLIFTRLQHAPTHSRGIIASFFRGRGKGVILPLEYLSYYHYISMYIYPFPIISLKRICGVGISCDSSSCHWYSTVCARSRAFQPAKIFISRPSKTEGRGPLFQFPGDESVFSRPCKTKYWK